MKTAPLVQFSKFTSKYHPKAIPLHLDRDGFFELFAEHDVRSGKDGMMFAPAIITGSREKGNFVSASGVCLDFDHGQPRIKEVVELFPGTMAAWYTTHSHGWTSKEKKGSNGKTIDPADTTFTEMNPRFRVVIPLSRPVDADEHALLAMGIKSIIPFHLMECLDATCLERTRAHYLPSCLDGHESHAFAGHQDGAPLNVDHFIPLGAAVTSGRATNQAGPAAAPPRSFEFINRTTGEVIDLRTWAAQNPGFSVVEAVDPQYRRGSLREDGKQHITCPFEDQHTDQGEDTATFIANASPPQYASFDVHCRHAHCADRDRLEFLEAFLTKGWISAEQIQTTAPALAQVSAEKKRPPKIYYPVNDILAAPEWSTLTADERQKAFHLMTLMWTEDDGAIGDDDWLIARQLGVSERDWKDGYRLTLTRTGWLINSGSRLTNAIVKREFDKAQTAYTEWIGRAAAGGRAAQEKARQKKLLEAPA